MSKLLNFITETLQNFNVQAKEFQEGIRQEGKEEMKKLFPNEPCETDEDYERLKEKSLAIARMTYK
ncbi:hypothetical protein [Thiomicrospira microaerophila]|uniref:hypothetical protein n=1 Tax=Thiomicrospira microaerophila TaxID=406020 RepID=UPI0005C8BC27|nr:hypothetical protein [Thiomicrospira microaerophila]